jgi:broad specificity phosphatase PhoE
MVARLFWVRHGPTHERAFTGWRDVPADLSDTAAIARLNAALPNGAIVISSDLSRAVTTADALTPGRMRLPHDPALREFDFGLWDGLEWHDVAARDPDLSRRFWEVPGDVAPPQGESWNAVTARVTAVIDRLADAHQGADLIAVAHFGAILTHLAQTGGMTPYQALGHKIDPLSLTELIRDGDGWRVVRINHIA